MLAHQLRWQQQQQPFALTWCWMQCFVAAEQQFVCRLVGNEEGFIEWLARRARRAGDDFFGARSTLARWVTRTAQQDTPSWGPWRPTSELKPHGYLNQCIWEVVVVGSGGGGGDRLSSEKLAEVGRGDGWGESARRWHGKMNRCLRVGPRSVKDQTFLWRYHAYPLREADAVGTAVTAILKTGRQQINAACCVRLC